MMTKGIIVVAVAFMFALTVGILTARVAMTEPAVPQSERLRCNTR